MCRVRLVCTLLDTCGSFFCKGKAGRRLDRFLAYFQRYLLAKPPLPLDVDFDVQVSYRCQALDINPCSQYPLLFQNNGESVLQASVPCISLKRSGLK